VTDADELYRALESSGRLSKLRRLTYRCRAGRCLLLDAVATPLGTICHQTRYKYSPAENERRSSESGRAANTYDGANHWKARTYWMGESALSATFWEDAGANLEVTCDHVLSHLLTARGFAADWDAGRTEVLI